MGQDQHGGGDIRQFFATAAKQIPQNPFFDIEDIIRPLGHVFALERLKYLGVAAEGPTDGILGGVVPHTDHLFDFFMQPTIPQHLEVSGEDRSVVVTQLLGNGLAIAIDFGFGRVQRPFANEAVLPRPHRAEGTAEGSEIPRYPGPVLRRSRFLEIRRYLAGVPLRPRFTRQSRLA